MLRGGIVSTDNKALPVLRMSARGLGRRQTPAATKADPTAVVGRGRRNCLRLRHDWYLLCNGGFGRPWPTEAGRAPTECADGLAAAQYNHGVREMARTQYVRWRDLCRPMPGPCQGNFSQKPPCNHSAGEIG